MKRSRLPSNPVITQEDTFKFSEEESSTLKDVLAVLSAKQFKAARMEAAGFDAVTIATSIKVVPQTITVWRTNPDYLVARDLFLSIINRQGIKFRLDCQRQIIAPAYAELMRRMNESRIVMSLDHKELLSTIKVIGKETRMDAVGTGGGEEDDELKELQERRSNFSRAAQATAVEDLKKDTNILSFPKTGTDVS